MEPKKNPTYDIHLSRGIIFNFSLAVSMLVVITAFQWNVKSVKKELSPQVRRIKTSDMELIPMVPEKRKASVTPEPIQLSEKKPSLESVNFKEVSDKKGIDESVTPTIDQDDSPMIEIPLSGIELPEEPTLTEFRVVEKMPEPVGGWETFFKTLQKNIKYPRKAERDGVSGKVFVEFTVNETGEPERLTVLKGIGSGCDEEAQRVIALTKWNAGKQRGKPVKVRLVQQVTFSMGTP